MKKIMMILVLAFVCSTGFTNNVDSTIKGIDSQKTADQLTNFLDQPKVVDLIGMSENIMSEELTDKLNLIGISFGHGIFATYQECVNFDPECVCMPHSGMRWICFIR